MSHEPPVKKRQRFDASSSTSPSSSSFSSTNSIDNLVDVENEWVEALQTRQCLCGISSDPWRPFQRYISGNEIDKLEDWPPENVLKLLTSYVLFFDVYLKQNRHGNICEKLLGAVKAMVNSHTNIVDDLLSLCEHHLRCKGADDAKFCLFLASRAISSYLLVVKDFVVQETRKEYRWLNKVVELLFNFQSLNDIAIRQINFSLDVIRNIIEFKDIEVHPLDVVASLDSLPLPPVEENYFARQQDGRNLFAESSSSTTTTSNSVRPNCSSHMPSNCQFVTLTDPDSYDTTAIKEKTIQILENKWPALVSTMTELIKHHPTSAFAESCVLTCLQLWENIISVKANLSVNETMPFHAQLAQFCDLLRTPSAVLNVTVYKQMLALFNEALCYGSTLALQDMLPVETTHLAHTIVRQRGQDSILDLMPRQPSQPLGSTEFGGKSPCISYDANSFSVTTKSSAAELGPSYDRVLMQRLTLLFIKSVAVCVKEIRSDSSSDSSFDSTDSQAMEDMTTNEEIIRRVLQRLKDFLKVKMEFHPEAHLSKILIHLFSDQDDYLIEAMVCTLDITTGINFRPNAFPLLVNMMNPVYTFLEFLKIIANDYEVLIDLLISNETCFLLYLLRFLKYVRDNWKFFEDSCRATGMNCFSDTMDVLNRLRMVVNRQVVAGHFPYDIKPILKLLNTIDGMYSCGTEIIPASDR